jgi:excisionase family DNA binding protein
MPLSEPDLMTVREVADYLRIKQRKVYDLLKSGSIPCTRVTGKWLFPRSWIDAWLRDHGEGGTGERVPRPPVVAGSHDPLLEWTLRESGCGLALNAGGSLDGLRRLVAGEAVVAGLHVMDADTGAFNVPLIARELAGKDFVALTWAWRQQGLVVAPGNPLGLGSAADLARPGVRVSVRQAEAGTRLLLERLLREVGLRVENLTLAERLARTQSDVAQAVLEGKADCGLAVEAAARPLKLGFVPLTRERYDLVVSRRDAFEPPFQRLLGFAGSDGFVQRAAELGGYDLAELGTVVYNGV